VSQAEQDLRIDYVEFGAIDMAATKRFYSEVFGWHFGDHGPDYVSFNDGRLRGGFAKAEEVKTGGPLVVIYTSSLEAMEAAVKKAGGTIVKKIFSFPGGRRFQFTDPNGNELAVWSDREA
jgi:uncharacterized protein